ncbi:MAG: hypothetical protein NC489_40680 [Ruminococcus flavefaciens]|nr:hypothetical protein [Ruminococcus flavefaciens]
MKQGIKEKDIRDFVKYANKLSNVVQRIRAYKPTVCVYLEQSDLCLMSDNWHKSRNINPNDLCVASVCIKLFDGGGF